MPEAWGGGFILTRPTAIHRCPMFFGVWRGTIRGKSCLPRFWMCVADRRNQKQKAEQWMEVFMTFLLLAGCTVVTVDALRHVIGGCVFYKFCMFQG